MHVLGILDKLNTLKTTQSRLKFLKKLPDDHEFWFGAAFAVNYRNACYPPILPNFNEPTEFGSGVPAGVFEKIVTGILSGKLVDYQTVRAINAFAARCTKDEWCKWYRPLLEGKLLLPLSPNDFTGVASLHYSILATKDITPHRLHMEKVGKHQIKPRTVEPFYDAPRVFIHLGTTVTTIDEDGRHIENPKIGPLEEVIEHTRMALVVDAYLESEEIIILRDVYSPVDLFEGRNRTLMDNRQEILVELARVMNEMGMNGVEVIERYEGSLREDIQTFFEQGFRGVVFMERPTVSPQPKLALPTKKNVMTCLDIISGEDEYSGKVEYLIGRGTIDKKRIESKVFYGLNWGQRDTYFKDRDQLIGKRFEILSCGLDASGRSLVMPIFQQWRT